MVSLAPSFHGVMPGTPTARRLLRFLGAEPVEHVLAAFLACELTGFLAGRRRLAGRDVRDPGARLGAQGVLVLEPRGDGGSECFAVVASPLRSLLDPVACHVGHIALAC